jgi:putrescine transport system substrate-binding protein
MPFAAPTPNAKHFGIERIWGAMSIYRADFDVRPPLLCDGESPTVDPSGGFGIFSDVARSFFRVAGIVASLRLRLAIAFVCGLYAEQAFADGASPFAPPTLPKPKIVRLLAYAEYFDRRTLDEFERASGYSVAYDAYDSPEAIADKWREGPYDLVVLPGPTLARRIASGMLARLDKSRLPAARAVQASVAAKLSAYDPVGVYSVAFGWTAIGLIYDADKAAKRLGGAPASWANMLLPQLAAKMSDCGIALPDARDALFIAAWRLMNVDPAKATLLEVKTAAAVLARAKSSIHGFGAPDVVGSLARGGDCLSMGSAGEAEAAVARSRLGGAAASIRFVEPREGGALSLDAFAIPRDAPRPDQAYALLQFLLRPDNSQMNAQAAGVVSAEIAGQEETLKHLWPEGAQDPRVSAAIETEWTRLRAAK